MKKLLVLVLCMFTLASCSTVYNYVQVVQTKPVEETEQITAVDDGYLYEDDDCVIYYSLWADLGETNFGIYNKTDKILYLDLSKCFFIKNGVAFNYFNDQVWTETHSSNVMNANTLLYAETLSASRSVSASKNYFNFAPISQYDPITTSVSASTSRSASASAIVSSTTAVTQGRSTSVETREAQIVAIPPRASKMIKSFTIASGEILDCDLVRYPERNSRIMYSSDNSPIVFANYLTYNLGNGTPDKTIKNEFYVAEVTNYTKPQVTIYTERAKECENVLTPEQFRHQKSETTVYDAYVNIPTNGCFYTSYKIISSCRLYKTEGPFYFWNSSHNGYLKGQQ